MHRNSIAARAGRWSAQHRRKAILGWIAFVVIALVFGGMIGTKKLDDDDAGTGESARADHAIIAAFPEDTVRGARPHPGPRWSDRRRPGVPTAVDDAVAPSGRSRASTDVTSPLAKGDEDQISKDGRSALVSSSCAATPTTATDARRRSSLAAVAAAQQARTPTVRIEAVRRRERRARRSTTALEQDFQRAETLSLPITLIILVLAFGALVAAGLPLLLGADRRAATIGLVGPISQLVPGRRGGHRRSILLVGLAVGVDYSLFYLRREREERDAGHTPRPRCRSPRRPRAAPCSSPA